MFTVNTTVLCEQRHGMDMARTLFAHCFLGVRARSVCTLCGCVLFHGDPPPSPSKSDGLVDGGRCLSLRDCRDAAASVWSIRITPASLTAVSIPSSVCAVRAEHGQMGTIPSCPLLHARLHLHTTCTPSAHHLRAIYTPSSAQSLVQINP